MIFRITKKLATKIKMTSLPSLPVDPNYYADWTAHLFTVDRTQYILITNTASLYSMVMYGRGITNDSQFLHEATIYIRKFLKADINEVMFYKFVAPEMVRVSFAKTLNRSVTGSMNDLIFQAKVYMTDTDISPFDVSFKLNEVPMSYLGYEHPRRVFLGMMDKGRECERTI
jgi:hypothetical protein